MSLFYQRKCFPDNFSCIPIGLQEDFEAWLEAGMKNLKRALDGKKVTAKSCVDSCTTNNQCGCKKNKSDVVGDGGDSCGPCNENEDDDNLSVRANLELSIKIFSARFVIRTGCIELDVQNKFEGYFNGIYFVDRFTIYFQNYMYFTVHFLKLFQIFKIVISI